MEYEVTVRVVYPLDHFSLETPTMAKQAVEDDVLNSLYDMDIVSVSSIEVEEV